MKIDFYEQFACLKRIPEKASIYLCQSGLISKRSFNLCLCAKEHQGPSPTVCNPGPALEEGEVLRLLEQLKIEECKIYKILG